jgi:chemotaxis methyl-accepting protein methylase
VGRELGELCRTLVGVRPDEARLAAHARSRARSLGLDLDVYVARIAGDREERATLVMTATNGWTWFWREAATLRQACERLRARCAGRAHAWVAGCSTGEEAYTLAMIAEEVGLEIEVLGTDVDGSRIERARRGRYDANALRHLPPHLERRFLRPTDGAGYEVRDSLRARVRFEVHNLLHPPPASPVGPWDLISCRNVLLHAEPELARRMLSNLGAALHPLGQRVLSAADELALETSRLSRRPRSMPPPAAAPPEPPSLEEAPPRPRPDPVSEAAAAFARGDRARAEAILRDGLEREPASLKARLALGNLCSSSHRFDEAAREYAAAERIDPQSTEALVMLGIVRRKIGRASDAEPPLRRAVFLERHLWIAWLLLAGLYERAGLLPQAGGALEAALIGLEHRPELDWCTPDFGVVDRRIDAATAKRLCMARKAALGREGERDD